MTMKNLLIPFGLLLTTVFMGCGSRGNLEILEARLREQEVQLSTMESQLQAQRMELASARREADLLRQDAATEGRLISSEVTSAVSSVEGLAFNKLLTGAVPNPGSNEHHVSVVLYPHDHRHQLVKVPAGIELEMKLVGSEPEDVETLRNWRISADEAGRYWQQGFLATGYVFDLDTRLPSEATELKLVASMTTVDGREFHAEHSVPIGKNQAREGFGSTDQTGVDPRFTSFSNENGLEGNSDRVSREANKITLQPVRTSDVWTDATIPIYR